MEPTQLKHNPKADSLNLKGVLETINVPNQLLDSNFQKKLIKVIIDDDKYAEQIIDIINVNYFDGVLLKMLFKYITDYYAKYNIVPKYDTLKDLVNDQESEITQKEHLLELITILKEYKLVDKPYVKDTALQFCQKQSLKKGIMDAIEAWDKGKYEEITKIISDSMKFGDSKSAGHNYSKDADSRLKRHYRNPIAALKGLDINIGGGLAGGELGVIMAPTGGGKSMMLVKFACSAYLAGKNVIYYTLELSERVVGNRFDSCLTQIPMKDIYEYPQAIKEKIEQIEKNGGRLYIKEYPTASASVLTIKNHLKILQREGFAPDVIFIDYADIMKATSEYSEKRFSLTSIYESIRGMSMELGIPIWTATQTNRDGINAERFDLKTIGESLGKAQTADVIIGIGRTDQHKQQSQAKLMILKNRNGEEGIDIDLHFDTKKIDIYAMNTKFDSAMGLKGLDIERQILRNNDNGNAPF
jgi:replicative DNA helicase